MRKMKLYPKLAARSMKNNRRLFLPYLLSVAGTVAAFYILLAMESDPGTAQMRGAAYVLTFMALGTFVVTVFAVIFLLYTNSFLMKRRRTELGLYMVLGLSRRNIAAILVFEYLYTVVIGIGAGLLAGILLHKLMTLILCKLMALPVPFGFSVSLTSAAGTAVLFAGILLLCLAVNVISVARTRPAELIRGSRTGEKEPKASVLLTVFGAVSLFGAYALALWVDSTIEAISYYFVAVIGVVIGTYCLFTSGSIALLKALRRNKRYYYKTAHFIGVSNMLYRMKRNAVGLANICVLSTMVMVMVSGTLSMYFGIDGTLDAQFGDGDLKYVLRYDPVSDVTDIDGLNAGLVSLIEKQGIEAKPLGNVEYLRMSVYDDGDGSFRYYDYFIGDGGYVSTSELIVTTAADFELLSGGSVPAIGAGEAYTVGYTAERVTLGDMQFSSAGELSYPKINFAEETASKNVYLVLADRDALLSVFSAQSSFGETGLTSIGLLSLDCSQDEALALQDALDSGELDMSFGGDWRYLALYTRAEEYEEEMSMAGSFLFLGVFLGVLFLMATALIMYYKQVSEGIEDRERFLILRKVGMDESDIRRSIRSQVLTVFFLPLLAAVVHIAFDFKLVVLMLAAFRLKDTLVTALCTLATVIVFFAVYAAVYALTAKTYYKTVK